MAETWTNAFGRYLRTLRERCSLSLHDVSSLSQTFADTLNKGYLSRCENGHQRLAFSKVIPLSRIYDIPSDVLLERMDLDMELDRVGGPDTEGMDYQELVLLGSKATNQGFKWEGYSYFRDALTHAAGDPLSQSFRDSAEQVACAHMNCGTAAMNLGKTRFALHEYSYIERSRDLGSRLFPVLLERISCAYRSVEELDKARGYADRAIEEAERTGEHQFLGYMYSNRALQAYSDSDLTLAATLFQKSFRTYRDSGRAYEAARALCNLAQVYFDNQRHGAARRALMAAEKAIQPLEQHRARALIRILLGEIEASENHGDLAQRRWREAAAIAKELNDKELRFKAEYQLLKHACQNGNYAVARAIHRRLSKLSNYIPKNTPELHDFEQLMAETKLVS